MRADRLITLLLLLQTRGRMSANALARELEVSERTIYRDIEALSASGVPVYGEAGRDGGYRLVDSYRTSLTGLTEQEVRALFMLRIPDALAQLGVGDEWQTAMLKLAAALPASRRADEEKARERFYLDSTPWEAATTAVPHLQIVHQAVWQTQKLRLTYALPFHAITVHHLVEPYGLVAKLGDWYLVYFRDRFRVQSVVGLQTVEMTDEAFTRLPDFDLVEFWRAWCQQQAAHRSGYRVEVRVAPQLLPQIVRHYAVNKPENNPSHASADGWTRLTLHFESLEAARTGLLPAGQAIEVLEPLALRASLADYARQILSLYRCDEAPV